MIRAVLIFTFVFGGLALAQAPQSPLPSISASPATNWVLPLFSDKEGYRSLTLRGSKIRPAGKDSIDVTDLSITVFSGDAKAHVDSVLLSAQATFFPEVKRAAGDSSVRLIRDDIEVTGSGWNYDYAAKKVSITRNVRVVFAAQLNDILK